ncbi:MAG: DsbA family protein [Candidatus Omnitrophica bacterium]|nr:DsbA family protein [Candidatus Omnitrophota bacterium]
MNADRRYLMTGMMLIFFLVTGVLVLKRNQPLAQNANEPRELSNSRGYGPYDAPVQIVEYSDFQCPACKRAQALVEKILEDYPGKIRLNYRHFPLEGHRWSSLAHQAAECAHQAGKFWEYQKRVYGDQAAWSVSISPSDLFFQYAKDLNLDMDAFKTCMVDPEVRRRIMDDKSKGQRLQVKATPTFFINNQRIVGQVELEINGIDLIRQILGLPPLPRMTPASSMASSPGTSTLSSLVPSIGVPGIQIPGTSASPTVAISAASSVPQEQTNPQAVASK